MRSAKFPLVSSDKQTNDTITYGSLELYIDTSYRKEHHARQYAYMVDDFKELRKHEKVYFHYLTILDAPAIPPNTWVVDYKMLYCVIRDSKIVMLNTYMLIEPLEEEVVSSIIIPFKKKSTSIGIVRHSSRDDLKDGDMVMFRKIAAFENEIEGVTYYVMESEDILAKINEI